jgi:sulfate transport system ATP-binding protein
VYGFLGDVNLFHGRAHEGSMYLGGVEIAAPEHQTAEHAQAYAFVRPHDLEVNRYTQGAVGIVAELQRAIVVGPIARLELWPIDHQQPDGHDPLIEARISAEKFRELNLKDGEKVVLSPKKARVFLHGHS